MSLKPSVTSSVPAETARIAHAAFPKGHPYLKLRDHLGSLFCDEQFLSLFSFAGQPAEAPHRLALVTILQFACRLSDRQAADAVRGRIEWKYLLGLELTESGFHHSILCEFRKRLLDSGLELQLLEEILRKCHEAGLLRARGRQRTDSTHVLAAIRTLNRLEMVGETFRRALNVLAVAVPEWLQPYLKPEWEARYGECLADQDLPHEKAARAELALVFGADGYGLLEAIYNEGAPGWLRDLPDVAILRAVWVQQYCREEVEGILRFHWREAGEIPPSSQFIVSCTDPEAHYAEKRGRGWVGYKVHWTETCDEGQPRLITDVLTTPAPLPDANVLAGIQERLAGRDLLPQQHFVDSGYVDAENLVMSQERDVTLIGPPPLNTTWQAKEAAGFAAEDFTVDWEAEEARCPQGERSVRWQQLQGRGRPTIRVHFAKDVCARCPQRAKCVRYGKEERMLTLLPRRQYEALKQARAEVATDAFRNTFSARAGIEGTHAQANRRCGVRACRYIGAAKTRLQHVATAAALNLIRVGEWLMGTPHARTRHDAFVRLLWARAT